MTPHRTGHAEIDQQHEILEGTVAQLAAFCSEAEDDPDAVCEACGSEKRQHCAAELASITRELLSFLIGHATYEEKMMELLPATPTCLAHVKGHKAAHAEIARQLKKASIQIGKDNPRTASRLIWRVISDWLGDHIALFDRRMVGLGTSAAPEIDFDGELVLMLDQHVFPNRPTRAKDSSRTEMTLQKKKLEMRGRLESLSPAQRAVFWLVVSGKKNREIGEELGITVNTVKTHRTAIFQKMDVASVLDLVRKADLLR